MILQICWYFADSWEQFRISGSIDAIDGSSADPAKLQVILCYIARYIRYQCAGSVTLTTGSCSSSLV
jgi:hypothetical protein